MATKKKAAVVEVDKGRAERIVLTPVGGPVAGTKAGAGWMVEAEGQKLFYATSEAMLHDVNSYLANPNKFRETVAKGLGF